MLMRAPTDRNEFDRRRRAKNWALLLVLVGLVLLFYIITIVRIGLGR